MENEGGRDPSVENGVRVDVESEYLPERSDPSAGIWVHAYHVQIVNSGAERVQLVNRHWIITNSHGVEHHVQGVGVVGEQPWLDVGEAYRYTSGCPMDTAVGTMHGSYEMATESGETFRAEIKPFTLAEPYALN